MSRFFRTFVAEMKTIGRIFLCFGLCVAMAAYGQDIRVEDVLEDIFNQLSEDGDFPYEDIEEELLSIAENPMNLNMVTGEDLSRLIFLSDEQIDAILLYQYEYGFKEIYELQLIDCLKDYEIRNLLPFVEVKGEVHPTKPRASSGTPQRLEVKGKDLYFREVFHYAKHEMTLRVDARNIEDFEGDPMYGKLRYRFNYQNRVQAGVTATMTTGDGQLAMNDRWDYGGYVQLRDVGAFKTFIAGNYQANFGYGLVVGSPFKRGKSAYVQSTATTDEGLKKYSSVGDGYNYFHGVGATTRIKWADMSAFYSLQREDDGWQHVLGANVTGRWKRLKVGVTGLEEVNKPTHDPSLRRENSDKVKGKGALGANVRYNWGMIDLWGEVAASQGEKWGVGTILGARFTPKSDVNLLAIYRYYSPKFNNPYANVLSSKTRVYDENGGYMGLEYNLLKDWKLSIIGDIWNEGYEVIGQSEYLPAKQYKMFWRLRLKEKDALETYSLRWNASYDIGAWKMKTQADGNIVKGDGKWTYGWSLYQDAEFRFVEIPIVLQTRAQIFNAKEWNNRVYIYENDVLYAYAMPFVYGIGGRFWVNARYQVNDIFSVYLRLSETVYQKTWAKEHDRPATRTDIHALLRVKL